MSTATDAAAGPVGWSPSASNATPAGALAVGGAVEGPGRRVTARCFCLRVFLAMARGQGYRIVCKAEVNSGALRATGLICSAHPLCSPPYDVLGSPRHHKMLGIRPNRNRGQQ